MAPQTSRGRRGCAARYGIMTIDGDEGPDGPPYPPRVSPRLCRGGLDRGIATPYRLDVLVTTRRRWRLLALRGGELRHAARARAHRGHARRARHPRRGMRSCRSAAPTARARSRRCWPRSSRRGAGASASTRRRTSCSFRERIRVDARPISEDAVADGVDALGTMIARLDATMFESTTALALDHFAQEGVEIAVLEVGLGGRGRRHHHRPSRRHRAHADRPRPRSVARPDASRDRAMPRPRSSGRAPRSPPRSRIPRPPRSSCTARRRSACRCLLEGRDLHVTTRASGIDGHRIDCTGPGWGIDDLAVPLLGPPPAGQRARGGGGGPGAGRRRGGDAGGARALPVARAASDRAPRPVGPVSTAPTIRDGARALAASLRALFPGRRVTFVLGVYADKDVRRSSRRSRRSPSASC